MDTSLALNAKWEIKVEKNDKILYIAFKLQIQKYNVDCIIAISSVFRDIRFEYLQLRTKQMLWY